MLLKHISRLAIVCCAFSPLANAANLDMTQFQIISPFFTSSYVEPNYARIEPGAIVGNSVVNVVSFDWNFSVNYVNPSYALLYAYDQYSELASGESLSFNGTTGWQTYAFATPYTGELYFMANSDQGSNVLLEITNVSYGPDANNPIPAVPEPETYAMLLAGLGLTGAIARRRAKRLVPA